MPMLLSSVYAGKYTYVYLFQHLFVDNLTMLKPDVL
jgi:hypothetical protein